MENIFVLGENTLGQISNSWAFPIRKLSQRTWVFATNIRTEQLIQYNFLQFSTEYLFQFIYKLFTFYEW